MANRTLEKNKQKEAFIHRFETTDTQQADWGSTQRHAAIEALPQLDIPTRKWEAWKYTQLKPLLDKDYISLQQSQQIDITPYLIPELDADLLVFVNGSYSAALSNIHHNTESLKVESLQTLSAEGKAQMDAHFGKLVAPDTDIFTALNTAYGQAGVLIYVPKGKIASAPIHILHLTVAERQAPLNQHRNVFVVERNAEAKVVESYHTVGDHTSLRTSVTEIWVGENAGLEYVKLQMESDDASQIDRTLVHQASSSRFHIHTFTISGEIVRNDLDIKLDGENITSELMGIYLLSGNQHVDNHTQVDHMKPHCYSNELYKGIIADKATAVFNGRIHVYQDAQKTNAFQANRNILLSNTANIYTKPQLEIYADDVKCSHGATTGKLDEDAMFYLQARGIKEEDARKMLIYAFAMEVADHLSMEPVRNYISNLIDQRY